MGKEAKPAIPKRACLHLMSGVWEEKNFGHTLAVSRGRSFSSLAYFSCIDSEGWISCSTESFSAVPSAVSRFSIIIKPVGPRSSMFLQGRDVKYHGTALEEGSIGGGAPGQF